MNQTWHLFRYDVKRSWPLLAGWLAFLLVVWVRAMRDPLEYPFGALFEPVQEWPTMIAMLAAWAGVGMLIVNDSPARSNSFWKTRPIDGRALLAAKAGMSALFFVVVPASLHAVWSFRFGYSVWGWLPEGGAQTLSLAALLLLAAAGASLLGSFSAYVAWSVTVLVATLLVQSALAEYLPNFTLPMWGDWLGYVVAAAALAVVGTAFVKRRRATAVALGCATWVMLNAYLHTSWLRGADVGPPPMRLAAATATLSPANPETIGFLGSTEAYPDGRTRTDVPTRLQIGGLRPHTALTDLYFFGEVVWITGGATGAQGGGGRGGGMYYATPLPGASPYDFGRHSDAVGATVWDAPAGEGATAGRLEAELTGSLLRVRLLGAAPIQTGARITDNRSVFQVHRVEILENKLRVHIRQRFLLSTLGYARWPQLRIARRSGGPEFQSTGERLMDDHGNPRREFLFPSPQLQDSFALFSLELPADGVDPSDLELRVYAFQPLGRVSIPLIVEDFQLMTAPSAPTLER